VANAACCGTALAEQGLSGPGSGQSGNSIGVHSGGGGPNVAANAEVGAGIFAGAGGASVALSVIWGVDAGTGGILTGAAIVATIADALYQIFSDLFGGSPPIPRQLLHGRHPLYAGIIGIRTGLIVSEFSEGPKFCSDPHPCNDPPLQRTGNSGEQPELRKAPEPSLEQRREGRTREPGVHINPRTLLFCLGAAAAVQPAPFFGCPAGIVGCYGGNPEGCAQAVGQCSVLGGIIVVCGSVSSRGGGP
jgi:hypothetical protein